MPPLLTLAHVDFSYGTQLILDNISFEIAQHQITTLIGPNGAGKSTLLKVILGLLKPDRGQVIRHPQLRIGYVPQRIHIPAHLPLQVKDFLDLAPYRLKDLPAFWKDFIAALHITDLASLQLSYLSSGQMQRILAAQAILQFPNLLILDEPSAGMDIQIENQFYHYLQQVPKETETSVLMVSHTQHLIMKASNQVLCLNHHLCCNNKKSASSLEINPPFAWYAHHHDHAHPDQ